MSHDLTAGITHSATGLLLNILVFSVVACNINTGRLLCGHNVILFTRTSHSIVYSTFWT